MVTVQKERGHKMTTFVTNSSDKSKTAALILCILGGLFGLHYFYVGRWGRGLVALFTFNFFMIGWIADIFTILNGKFQDNIGNYLRS